LSTLKSQILWTFSIGVFPTSPPLDDACGQGWLGGGGFLGPVYLRRHGQVPSISKRKETDFGKETKVYRGEYQSCCRRFSRLVEGVKSDGKMALAWCAMDNNGDPMVTNGLVSKEIGREEMSSRWERRRCVVGPQ
jgi:hypothetical protein